MRCHHHLAAVFMCNRLVDQMDVAQTPCWIKVRVRLVEQDQGLVFPGKAQQS